MTKFERYDRATDALEDAAMSLRVGLGQLHELPEQRDKAVEIKAIIHTLETFSAGIRLKLMGDARYRKHLSRTAAAGTSFPGMR